MAKRFWPNAFEFIELSDNGPTYAAAVLTQFAKQCTSSIQ